MNFFCISSYNNNLDWLKEFDNPHIIYDKTWAGGYKDNNSKKLVKPTNLKIKYPFFNVVNGNPNGYNVCDYLTFIIDNFEKLPENTVFLKGNIIGRHIRKETFLKVFNNKFFTCIEDCNYHNLNQKSIKNGYALITCDGGWMEKNTSWYLHHHLHPIKYFLSYNNFMKFCFINPVIPKYIRFPPGGCFIVPKNQILKYDVIFYKNLKTFVEHSRISGEGQLIERALYTIWNCNFEVSDRMKKEIDKDNFPYPNKYRKKFYYFSSKLKNLIKLIL